jgi:tripartite-type tricarboxylate transporter receptor subunit TctC
MRLAFPMAGRRPFLLACALACTGRALAQAFPAKPIRLIVPYPPGGPLDIAARALAEGLRGFGTFVVENRSGAGGNIGADAVAKAAPDGYTLLMGAVATHAINPALQPKMPYDAAKDFAPITLVANVPNVLVLEADYAARQRIGNVADFVAHLRANPGRLQFGSGGNGSAGHLAGELFKMRTQTFALHIPYRGAPPAQLALLSGEVHFMFDNLASAAPRVRDGRLVALGVTTQRRAKAWPEIVPLAESGVKGLSDFDISTWFGLFAPAQTPRPVLEQLHAAVLAAMSSKAFADTLAQLAAEPAPNSPAEFAGLVAGEASKYEAIVRRSNIKPD